MSRCLRVLVLLAVPSCILAQGGFSFNPNPFWCNSVPQFAPCAQPAIPICCGPCYQGAPPQPAPVAGGAGGAGAGGPAPGGVAPAGGAGGGGGPAPGGAGGNGVQGSEPAVPAGTGTGAKPPVAPAGAGTGGSPTGGSPTGGAPTGGAPNGGSAGPPVGAGAATPAPAAGGAGAAVTPAAGGVSPAAGAVTPAAGGADANSTANCPISCPAGWLMWSAGIKNCYLIPPQPLHSDTFWNQQAYCKSKDPTANIWVVNDLAEQAWGSAASLQYAPSWFAQATNIYWWLGGYGSDDGKWHFVDGSDPSGNPAMTLASLVGAKNGTCIGADAKTLGAWATFNCEDKVGAVVCEMPKRPVCGPQGSFLPISPIELTPEKLKDLFPKAPSIPFISGLLGGGGGAGGGGAGPAAAAGGANPAGAAGGAGGAAGAAGALGGAGGLLG